MEQTVKLRGEQYNLKWNSFARNLIDVIQEKQTCEALTDVSFYCEGKILRAHKIILASSSCIFEDMFKHNVDKHPYIILNGVTLKILKYVIEFIYFGEVKVFDCDLQNVLSLGETLQIKGLSSVKVKGTTGNNAKTKTCRCADTSTGSTQTINKSLQSTPITTSHGPKDPLPPEVPSVSEASHLNYVENTYFQDIAEGVVKWQKVDKINKECGKDSVSNINENIPPKKRKIVEENIEEPQDLRKTKSMPVVRIKSPETLQNTTKPIKTNNDVSKSCSKVEKLIPKLVEPKVEKNPSETIDNNKIISLTPVVPQPPKNAFMLFTSEQRDKLAAENPNKSYKEISIMLGDMWKSLSDNEKQIYYSKADGIPSNLKNSNFTNSPKQYKKQKTIEKMSTTTGCVEIEIPDDDVETIDVTGDSENIIQIAPDFFS